jgi:hypothetical protein
MKPRNILLSGVCGLELGHDFIERQRRGIDDTRAIRTIIQ